ncbi:unnamed protein product [Moneuplotes crassus]|uniref:Uncharacterized protein n=1 Tax=Euplotes crassus TaxID=5936 RepID=A0AAD1U2U1_EUPCR|nr:unnamed protein product [Moneuplotes crassus]
MGEGWKKLKRAFKKIFKRCQHKKTTNKSTAKFIEITSASGEEIKTERTWNGFRKVSKTTMQEFVTEKNRVTVRETFSYAQPQRLIGNEVRLSSSTRVSQINAKTGQHETKPQKREYPFEKLTREMEEVKEEIAQNKIENERNLQEKGQLQSSLEETRDKVASLERRLDRFSTFESTMTSIAEDLKKRNELEEKKLEEAVRQQEREELRKDRERLEAEIKENNREQARRREMFEFFLMLQNNVSQQIDMKIQQRDERQEQMMAYYQEMMDERAQEYAPKIVLTESSEKSIPFQKSQLGPMSHKISPKKFLEVPNPVQVRNVEEENNGNKESKSQIGCDFIPEAYLRSFAVKPHEGPQHMECQEQQESSETIVSNYMRVREFTK